MISYFVSVMDAFNSSHSSSCPLGLPQACPGEAQPASPADGRLAGWLDKGCVGNLPARFLSRQGISRLLLLACCVAQYCASFPPLPSDLPPAWSWSYSHATECGIKIIGVRSRGSYAEAKAFLLMPLPTYRPLSFPSQYPNARTHAESSMSTELPASPYQGHAFRQ